MRLSCYWIPFTEYHSRLFCGVGGMGGSIFYTIIYWPPPPPQSIRNVNHGLKFNCLWYLHVLSNEAKLTLYSIVKITFLNISLRGGVNILYHNITPPPPPPTPINKKCQPWTRIVWDIYMFWVMKLSWNCIPMSKYLSLIFGGWVGGGGSKYHTIIFWPPPSTH